MDRIESLLLEHPVEIAVALAACAAVFLLVVRILRIRMGFPAVIFVCLFLILSATSSLGYLQVVCKGGLRWIALALMAALVCLNLRYTALPQNRPTSTHWGWILFLGFVFCMVPMSDYQRFSAMSAVAVTMMFLAAFGTVWLYMRDVPRIVQVVDTIVKLALVVLGLGFLFLAVPGAHGPLGSRFQGFFNNPNWNGNFSAITFPLVLWKVQYPRDRFERRLMIALAVVLPLNIVLSGSRGAILAGLVGAGLAQYRLNPAKLARNLAILIPLLVAVLATQVGREYMETHVEKLARVERAATLTHRTEMWSDAWPAIRAHLPWGMGLGNSRFILLSGEEEERGAEEVGGAAANLHSQHVVTLAELGVVGIGFLWLFIFHVFAMGIRLWGRPRNPVSDLGFAAFCSCVVVFGDSILHGWMLSAGSAYALMFWIIVAVLLKTELLSRQSGRGRPPVAGQTLRSKPSWAHTMSAPPRSDNVAGCAPGEH